MCAARMHADEADIDEALVRRLIAAQFPQWADLPVEPVDSAGTENAMFRLGTDRVARLPRRPDAAADVEREQRWLPRLGPLLPVAVPDPVGRGRPVAGEFPWAWSVYRWLPGVNPEAGRVAEPVRLAEDLAGFVTGLRRIDPGEGPASGRGVPLADRDAPTRRAIAALEREPDPAVDTAAVTAAWQEALRLPARTGPPVWAHGDLSPGNVLVTGGRLSAVIDFGGVGVGDPTVDLIAAWNLLPPGARGAFREALRADDATWARGRGWALSIALIQLPYYRRTNPVLAASARHVIHEVLADRAGLGYPTST